MLVFDHDQIGANVSGFFIRAGTLKDIDYDKCNKRNETFVFQLSIFVSSKDYTGILFF